MAKPISDPVRRLNLARGNRAVPGRLTFGITGTTGALFGKRPKATEAVRAMAEADALFGSTAGRLANLRQGVF